MPSGILSPGCTPVIANGVVIDLGVLFQEIDGLNARGISCDRLLVSADAHVIADYNRVLDRVTERFLGSRRIGTTGRGIGPTYADKMNRVGIRVQDLFDEKILRAKVEGALELKNQVLVKVYNRKAVTVDSVVEELLSYVDRLRPMVADTSLLLNEALDAGKTVLLEGGQATLLDVDHGTYPFVTSSSATAGGACTGSGIPPTRIDKVIAVIKAYTTRVGEGPFPTELLDADGEQLRAVGHEYGTTTGSAASLRLVRRRHRALRGADQRRHRLRPDQARRAGGLGEDPGLRRVRGRRRPVRRDADDADRLPPRDAGLRVPRRLDRGHQRGPHLRGPAEERAALRPCARGDERRALQLDRRGPGPRADPRAAPAPVTERGQRGGAAPVPLHARNNFDLIRLMAAVQVVLYHSTLLLGLTLPYALWLPLVALPGVPIFFVVSGFLITGALLRDPTAVRYGWHRFLRIYPALWVCFAVTVALVVASDAITAGYLLTGRGLVWIGGQLALAKNTPEPVRAFGAGTPNSSLWTIIVELQFYVIAFVLMRIGGRQRSARFRGLLLAGTGLATFVVSVLVAAHEGYRQTSPVRLLDMTAVPHFWLFAMGATARLAWGRVRHLARLPVLWLAATLTWYALVTHHLHHPLSAAFQAPVQFGLLAMTVLAFAHTAPGTAWRTLRGIDVSYGVYLYHFVILNCVLEWLPGQRWPGVALVLGASVAVGMLSWFLVERPALSWKNRGPFGRPVRAPEVTQPA